MRRLSSFLLVFFLCGCGASKLTPARESAEIIHVVVCWLKNSGNDSHQEELIKATEKLRQIPGIVEIRVGKVLPSDRLGVDSSFDLAFVFRFRDEAALRNYETHPVHLAAVNETLKPLVRKFVVYDLSQ